MGSIALNYDSIYSAAKNAKKVASTAEDYVSSLQKKIINKIDEFEGASTTYVNNARSSTTDKITRLNTKKDAYTEYFSNLRNSLMRKLWVLRLLIKELPICLKMKEKSFEIIII